MQHAQMGADRGNGAGLALLLDMGMESIIHDAQGRVIDQSEIVAGLCHGVEEIGLEAVERLEAEIKPVAGGAVGQSVMGGGTMAPLLRRRARPGEMADRRMNRAAQAFGAQRDGAVEGPVEMGAPGRALAGIGADRVGQNRGNHRCRRPAQADPVELAAQPGIMVGSAAQHRHFNPVIAEPLELVQLFEMAGFDEAAEAKQIDPDQHGSSVFPNSPAGHRGTCRRGPLGLMACHRSSTGRV